MLSSQPPSQLNPPLFLAEFVAQAENIHSEALCFQPSGPPIDLIAFHPGAKPKPSHLRL